MGKGLFGADKIHALRLKLAERRGKMSPNEALRNSAERANRGRRAIEEIRASRDSSGQRSRNDNEYVLAHLAGILNTRGWLIWK